MRNVAGLGLVQKAGRRGHAYNRAQLHLWYTGQFGDIFSRDAPSESNVRKHLEFAQPLQTREKLTLYHTIKRDWGPERKRWRTWLARC